MYVRGLAAVVVAALILAALPVGTFASTLPSNPTNDPKADRDALSEMAEAEQQSNWSGDSGSVADMIDHLRSFELLVSVDVKLVGWVDTTEKAYSSHLSERDFFRYFEAIQNQNPVTVIHPADGEHQIPIKTRFMYQVVQAKSSLTARLSKAVSDYMNANDYQVPYTVVDDIIAEDYEDNTLSYTIYLLNLRKSSADNTDSLGERAYFYTDPAHSATQNRVCGFQVWAGKGRYMWIDLSAGPVTYGPRTSGDGVVTRYTLPRVEDHEKPEDLVADLVSVVRTTSNYLISPSLSYFPLPYVESINVHVIIITDMLAEGQTDDDFVSALDWKVLKENIEGLGLKGQEVSLGKSVMSFRECELCAAAYTHALKTSTSNVLGADLRTQIHQYLDSKVLYEWLKRFGRDHWALDLLSDDMRILPVFLFELSTENILLLDRFHQALSFPEFVIAVQTRGARAMVDYQCMDGPVTFDTKDATRAVLAAALESGWGVTAPYTAWSSVHNYTLDNYLWAVGHTPFGYFSSSTELSFAPQDAARRNVLFTLIHSSIKDVHDFLHHFKGFNAELDDVLTYSAHAQFIRRWNVFRFKLDKAAQYLTVHNYNHALYYLKSLRHDVRGLHELIHLAGTHLSSKTTCQKQRVDASGGQGWLGTLLWVVGISTPATYLYVKFRGPSRTKQRML